MSYAIIICNIFDVLHKLLLTSQIFQVAKYFTNGIRKTTF